jgi:aromatic-L-amino-acid/L-tryptophan decarboxylase
LIKISDMSISRTRIIQIPQQEFKKIGYELIDKIAVFLDTIEQRPVTTGKNAIELQDLIGNDGLPENGISPDQILSKATDLLFNHSLLNGHPKFAGYITSAPAPLGALADLLASVVNPNVGANILSPMATAIEKQTIKWLAAFIGLPPTYGGLLVSGGNMANFTAFLAARTIKAPPTIKEEGISNSSMKLTVYCSASTHTWIEKAAVLFGLGLHAIRWVAINKAGQMNNSILEQTINEDLTSGYRPIMVIGTAGDVSTGAVDDLKAIATICRKYDLWFHVDGAYGIPAAVVPELKPIFEGIEEADSVALDPHKWLYTPLEAGCILVKNPNHLITTYSSHPVYYNFNNDSEIATLNYYEYGFQNSRGFRALKVWTVLQQVGRVGYVNLIREDIALSELLFKLAAAHSELEAITQNLSIATFRYIPKEYQSGRADHELYLNTLNEALVNKLQSGGEVFLSNAVVGGKYCLRACVVNFRSSEKDIREIADTVIREGRKMHQNLISVKDNK